MHLGGYVDSQVELLTLKAAEKHLWRLLLIVRPRLTVQTAGHELKHDAGRAEIRGGVSVYTYISSLHLSLATSSKG